MCFASGETRQETHMPRVDTAWSRANSLVDLGRLTADWLEGRLWAVLAKAVR